MTKFYKPIKRKYWDNENKTLKEGVFIARGQWANGKLAYTMLDESGKEIEGEECAYIQYRAYDGLYMERI